LGSKQSFATHALDLEAVIVPDGISKAWLESELGSKKRWGVFLWINPPDNDPGSFLHLIRRQSKSDRA
jgi:hypothetical protein